MKKRFFGLMSITVMLIILFVTACPVEPSPLPQPHVDTFTVTFDPNFGDWSGDFDNKTIQVNSGAAVAAPIPAPTRRFSSFDGWYTEQIGGERYNFASPVKNPITLYARWSVTFRFTSTAEVSTYLGGQAATSNTPLFLPVSINLASDWINLLTAIGVKYVVLDLSACTMTGTVFDPVPNNSNGKQYIVHMILPDAARSIVDYNNINVPFLAMTNLRSFSASGLTSIGNGSIRGATALVNISLPEELKTIGNESFLGCANLVQVTMPRYLNSIGNEAFSGCTKLALVILRTPVPPTLGTNVFNGTSENLQIKVPAGSVGVYKAASNWSSLANRIHSINCNALCTGTCE